MAFNFEREKKLVILKFEMSKREREEERVKCGIFLPTSLQRRNGYVRSSVAARQSSSTK